MTRTPDAACSVVRSLRLPRVKIGCRDEQLVFVLSSDFSPKSQGLGPGSETEAAEQHGIYHAEDACGGPFRPRQPRDRPESGAASNNSGPRIEILPEKVHSTDTLTCRHPLCRY